MRKVLWLLFWLLFWLGVLSIGIVSANDVTNTGINYYKKVISSWLNISLTDKPAKEITEDDLYKIKGYVSDTKKSVIMWKIVVSTTGWHEYHLYGSKIGKYIPYFVIKDKYPDLLKNYNVVYEKITIDQNGNISISWDLSDQIKNFMKENRCNTLGDLQLKLECINKSVQKAISYEIQIDNFIKTLVFMLVFGLLLVFIVIPVFLSLVRG